MAMSVTQASIWHYGNSDPTKLALKEQDVFSKEQYGNKLTTVEQNNLKTLYEYLTSSSEETLSKIASTATPTTDLNDLINASSVKEVSVTVTKVTTDSTNTNGQEAIQSAASITKHSAYISFKLDVQPGTLLKDTKVTVTVKDADGNEYQQDFELDGTSKFSSLFKNNRDERTYTLHLNNLPGSLNGVNVAIRLSGVQEIKQGAYLISATGGYDKSQTFISVEKGTRAFDMNLSLNLATEAAAATVTTTVTPETTKTETIHREWDSTEKVSYDKVLPEPEEPNNPTTPEDPTTPPPTPRDPDPDPSDDPEIPDEPVPLTYIPDEPVPQVRGPGDVVPNNGPA